MNYTKVENPVWNKERTAINCLVTFEEIGTVPFSAVPEDRYPYVVEIYQRCLAEEFGLIAEYVPAPDEGPQPYILPEQTMPVTDIGATS